MITEGIEREVGRREARKLDRRKAIVDAARRAFLDDGYAATSMSGLLKTLGGSKATLWSYFRSKEELFAAVVADVTAEFRKELEDDLLAPAELEETLVTFCYNFMNKTIYPDSIAAWRLIVGESGRFPELGRIFYEQAAKHVEGALCGYLESQIAAGFLRDEGAKKMAQVLLGICGSQQNRWIWGIEPFGKAELRADAALFAAYFLRLFKTE